MREQYEKSMKFFFRWVDFVFCLERRIQVFSYDKYET